MDWSGLGSLTDVGWPTVTAMAIALAGLVAGSAIEGRLKRERELKEAEQAYRAAVASGDPDRIRIAAAGLRDARKRSGQA